MYKIPSLPCLIKTETYTVCIKVVSIFIWVPYV